MKYSHPWKISYINLNDPIQSRGMLALLDRLEAIEEHWERLEDRHSQSFSRKCRRLG